MQRRISRAKLETMDIDDLRDIAGDNITYTQETADAAQKIVDAYDYR